MKRLCRPGSLPHDFEMQLELSARQGGRVLAVAGRAMPGLAPGAIKDTPRADMEGDLHFLGFAVFQNQLKEHTAGTLAKLDRAGIRTVMVTGDNVLTACSIAQQANMVRNDCPILLLAAVNTAETVVEGGHNASPRPHSVVDIGGGSEVDGWAVSSTVLGDGCEFPCTFTHTHTHVHNTRPRDPYCCIPWSHASHAALAL